MGTWTKKQYHTVLADFGIEFNKSQVKNNVDLDALLVKTLQERNPKDTNIAEIMTKLHNDLTDPNATSVSTNVADDKGEDKTDATDSPIPADFNPQCPVWGEFDAASDDCKACAKEFEKEHKYCLIKTAEINAGRKTGSGKKGDGSIVTSRWNNIKELTAFLNAAPDSRVTICMDKALVNKATWTGLVKMAEATNDRLGRNDFKTAGRIKSHVKHREGQGWVFTYDADTVQLTGYEKPATA